MQLGTCDRYNNAYTNAHTNLSDKQFRSKYSMPSFTDRYGAKAGL